MAEDLTDVLRAIIEPIKGQLITAALRHKLEVAQEELGDSIRHAERAQSMITDILDGAETPEDKPGSYVTGSRPVTVPGPQPGEIWELSNGDYAVICKDPGKALQVAKGTLKALRPSNYYRLAGDLRAVRLVDDDVRRHRIPEEMHMLTTRPAVGEIWEFPGGKFGRILRMDYPTAETVDKHGFLKDNGVQFRFSLTDHRAPIRRVTTVH